MQSDNTSQHKKKKKTFFFLRNKNDDLCVTVNRKARGKNEQKRQNCVKFN